MYSIDIKNFLGCKSATVPLKQNSITLVAGDNEAGKSSLAKACRSILASTSPFAKTRAIKAIHWGADKATVTLKHDSGIATMTWVDGDIQSVGETLLIKPSANAMGSKQFSELKEKERAELLLKLLKGLPTEQELTEALVAQQVPIDDIKTIWTEGVVALGWDAKHAEYDKECIIAKRAYTELTGQQFGKDKNWMPEGYTQTDLSEQGLKANLDACIASLEVALKHAGAKEANIKELEAKVANLAAIEGQKATSKHRLDAITAEYEDVLGELKELNKHSAPTPCPHCQGALLIDGGKIIAADPINTMDADLLKAENARLGELSRALDVEIQKEKAEHEAWGAKVKECQAAASEIARAKNAIKDEAPSMSVEGARAAVEGAKRQLDLFKRVAQVRRKEADILKYEALRGLFAPDGLRLKKLTERLNELNERAIAPLCAQGGWEPITINPDMSISCGRADWDESAESAQFRINVIMQVVICKLQGQPAIIIDRADLLKKRCMAGLMKILTGSGLAVLLIMSANKPEDVPDMRMLGAGWTLWLESGVAKEIGAAVPA